MNNTIESDQNQLQGSWNTLIIQSSKWARYYHWNSNKNLILNDYLISINCRWPVLILLKSTQIRRTSINHCIIVWIKAWINTNCSCKSQFTCEYCQISRFYKIEKEWEKILTGSGRRSVNRVQWRSFILALHFHSRRATFHGRGGRRTVGALSIWFVYVILALVITQGIG